MSMTPPMITPEAGVEATPASGLTDGKKVTLLPRSTTVVADMFFLRSFRRRDHHGRHARPWLSVTVTG
jgi:hypothetical protein